MRFGEIGLGHDQPVGEDDLSSRLRGPCERVEAGHGIDHCDDHLDVEFPTQCPIGGEGLQDRAGIGQTTGLDHDALEPRHRAVRALGLQPAVFHLNEGHAAFLILELLREHQKRIVTQMAQLNNCLDVINLKVAVYEQHLAQGTAQRLWTADDGSSATPDPATPASPGTGPGDASQVEPRRARSPR